MSKQELINKIIEQMEDEHNLEVIYKTEGEYSIFCFKLNDFDIVSYDNMDDRLRWNIETKIETSKLINLLFEDVKYNEQD